MIDPRLGCAGRWRNSANISALQRAIADLHAGELLLKPIRFEEDSDLVEREKYLAQIVMQDTEVKYDDAQ